MEINSSLIQQVFPAFTGEEVLTFQNVFTDSRKQVENGLFIPLVGERFDGHDFIQKAKENGAIASLWQKDHDVPKEVTLPLFFVEDTLKALQQLARLYLEECRPTVIGITGSNGKTTTKDMVEAICNTTFRTYKTQGNFNNHIGLPLTILSMPVDTEILILEMGMSGFHEIELLSQLARPTYGIITNIGDSHLEQLKTRANIAKAKLEIKAGLQQDGILIIDGDEPLLENELRKKQTISCGFSAKNDRVIGEIQQEKGGLSFCIKGSSTRYHIPYFGYHNSKNAAYAIVIGQLLKINEEKMKEALQQLTLTSMRFEMIPLKNGALLINDAYNASPTSMKAALETLSSMSGYSKKVAVLGDMYELGHHEKRMHESVVEMIDDSISLVCTIGKKAKWIHEKLKQEKKAIQSMHFTTKEDAVVVIKTLLEKDMVVLLKASRGMQLETIAEALQEGRENH
ncbi:MAG TPA: UDP-N-acetylmuramoyl-tripeptide--D-alanyl-D-alanine ligase [Massilibacterium sp.]|mgnify:CR=1 FL=1|nr:UDP-N-acetylmuramoyl-tripeptide--D-alanyl-D-alanine ligase [Massilibacterium sp.]